MLGELGLDLPPDGTRKRPGVAGLILGLAGVVGERMLPYDFAGRGTRDMMEV